MELFPARLVADLQQMPGAGHSFLKQICAPDGEDVRGRLQRLLDGLGPVMQERVAGLLGSLDNRRFFQGFAELSTLAALAPAGWDVASLHTPGPRLELRRPGGAPTILSVLAFLHQTRPGGEEETRKRLLDSLSRVSSRQRFAVLVRRWLPHDFDPEPVRRAIELWLTQVANGNWEGRYAAYEDEHIALEFCLTGEKAKAKQSPVALAMGPFYAHRSLEVLEPRVVQELDRHRTSPQRTMPLLLAAVSDQPWALNEGYIRDFLYGRASRMSFGEEAPEYEFSGPWGACVFRDPLYTTVSGLVLLDRRPVQSSEVRVRAYLNPWAKTPLTPADVGFRCFAEDPEGSARARRDGPADARVLRWHAARPA
jgi:hypothetical protein